MLSREFFLYVSENYSFIFTRICLNLKEIILKGTITWSTLGQQTNEAKEVYSRFHYKFDKSIFDLVISWSVESTGQFNPW